MPPIRRYIRVSPHSCLEVRIFLDNPADVSTWLLRPSNPALPRVFDAVRPLILPKLKEENERARLTKGKSGKKKKGVKDVVKGNDFEVVVFLTEGQGRHEVVIKRRQAREAQFGTRKTVGDQRDEPVVIQEEDDDGDNLDLRDVPPAEDEIADTEEIITTKVRRRERANHSNKDSDDVEADQDEKKKLGFRTRYEGFSIWGKVLCLLVERKGGSSRRAVGGNSTASIVAASVGVANESSEAQPGAQQALMQEWISSTQVPQDENEDE